MVLDFLLNRDKIYLPNQKIDNYTILKVIGEGRYGICYLLCQDDKQYVFKQLKKSILKKIRQKANLEEEILTNIKHKSIPKLIKKIEQDNCLGYILELKEGKTFEEIIFNKNYIFQRKEIYDVAIQIIKILKYLHKLEIVHRDIRLPNLLYNDGKISLIDFGLARKIDNKKYSTDVDFFYLGDFLIHLYYTGFKSKMRKEWPWYDELPLINEEKIFLKRLMGIEKIYNHIDQVEEDFLSLVNKNP